MPNTADVNAKALNVMKKALGEGAGELQFVPAVLRRDDSTLTQLTEFLDDQFVKLAQDRFLQGAALCLFKTKTDHGHFEKVCRDRWGMSPRVAQKRMAAARKAVAAKTDQELMEAARQITGYFDEAEGEGPELDQKSLLTMDRYDKMLADDLRKCLRGKDASLKQAQAKQKTAEDALAEAKGAADKEKPDPIEADMTGELLRYGKARRRFTAAIADATRFPMKEYADIAYGLRQQVVREHNEVLAAFKRRDLNLKEGWRSCDDPAEAQRADK